jgi:hypothetical protein
VVLHTEIGAEGFAHEGFAAKGFAAHGAKVSVAMPAGRHTGHRAPNAAAKARAARAVIAALQAAGVTTLRGIADELNRRGVPTAAGTPHWQPMQVSRVLRRLSGT